MRPFATLLLTTLLALTLPAKAGEAQGQNKRRRPVTITTEGQALVLTVPGGDIGGCELLRPAGGWPKQVILRLLGPSLYYEGFHLSTKDWTLGESLRPGVTTFELRKKDAAGPDAAPVGAPENLRLTVTKTAAGIELVLPARLLQDTAQIEVQWIDFYR